MNPLYAPAGASLFVELWTSCRIRGQMHSDKNIKAIFVLKVES